MFSTLTCAAATSDQPPGEKKGEISQTFPDISGKRDFQRFPEISHVTDGRTDGNRRTRRKEREKLENQEKEKKKKKKFFRRQGARA